MINKFQPCSLSSVVASEDLTIADVACLSDLSRSTISRLWDNANWMHHVSGKSLQALAASVPAIANYVLMFAETAAGQRSNSL